MNKRLYKFIHISSYLTIIHGLVYWVLKEFLQIETEYGLRPHPLQTYAQAVHIVLSPLLIVSLGLLWQKHIVHYFKKKSKKLYSGTIITVCLILISFSGYFIQVIYNDPGKEVAIWVHLVFSAFFIAAYLFHHFLSLKRK